MQNCTDKFYISRSALTGGESTCIVPVDVCMVLVSYLGGLKEKMR